MQILRHFLPQDDLNLETLRSIAKELTSGNSPIQDTAKNVSIKAASEQADSSVSNDSEPDTEEIGDLHHQLGCLMKDSLGEYRKYHIPRLLKQSIPLLTLTQDILEHILI